MNSIKPVRGPKKPTYNFTGISHSQLIYFIQDYHKKCLSIGEEEAAFRLEMMLEYFKKDFSPDAGLKFESTKLGF